MIFLLSFIFTLNVIYLHQIPIFFNFRRAHERKSRFFFVLRSLLRWIYLRLELNFDYFIFVNFHSMVIIFGIILRRMFTQYWSMTYWWSYGIMIQVFRALKMMISWEGGDFSYYFCWLTLPTDFFLFHESFIQNNLFDLIHLVNAFQNDPTSNNCWKLSRDRHQNPLPAIECGQLPWCCFPVLNLTASSWLLRAYLTKQDWKS